jgi:hypothetical protein
MLLGNASDWFAVPIRQDHVVLKDNVPAFSDLAWKATFGRPYLQRNLVNQLRDVRFEFLTL